MEVELDVDAVLLAEPHRLVDLLERAFAEPGPVARVGPAAVVEREPDEVEAELGDPGEVVLAEGLLVADA